jgi:hypothetical protein
VQTVDECLVIIPRPVFDMLQFDEKVCDDWHLAYAIDYSLSVARLGLGAHVIPASIYHSSTGIPIRNIWQTILSIGILPAGYYQTMRKLLKKHRSHAKQVYTTCGLWSTSYPLILRRAEEALRAVYREALAKVLRKGIVSKPRNACKRFLSAVKHTPDSDAQKLD